MEQLNITECYQVQTNSAHNSLSSQRQQEQQQSWNTRLNNNQTAVT